MNLSQALKLYYPRFNQNDTERNLFHSVESSSSDRLYILSSVVGLLLPIAATLVILRSVLLIFTGNFTTESFITLVGSLLVMFIVYSLARLKFYLATIVFAVVCGSAVMLIQALNSGEPYISLVYLILLPVFSVTLRSPRETTWVSAVVFLDLFLFGYVVHMTVEQFGEWLAFFAFIQTMLIISTFYLVRLERDQRMLIVERQNREALQQFMTNMSHDLKTPISVIYTSLHLLEKDQNVSKHPDYVERIRTHTRLLDKHIQSILTMSRLDNDPHATLSSVHLETITNKVLSHLRPIADDKQINLELQVQPLLPRLCARADDFERAIFNLVENALRYTPQNGHIQIKIEKVRENIQIIVKDSGIGIAEEDIPHIFERFYRTDTARNSVSGGYGLGLAIVKKVVELHQGTITVQSQLDVGTSFIIVLPITGDHGCQDIREAARVGKI